MISRFLNPRRLRTAKCASRNAARNFRNTVELNSISPMFAYTAAPPVPTRTLDSLAETENSAQPSDKFRTAAKPATRDATSGDPTKTLASTIEVCEAWAQDSAGQRRTPQVPREGPCRRSGDKRRPPSLLYNRLLARSLFILTIGMLTKNRLHALKTRSGRSR